MRRSWRVGLGIAVTGAGVAFACGGDSHDFGKPPSAPAGGEAGAPEVSNTSGTSGSAGSSAVGQGGDSAGTGSGGEAVVGPIQDGGAAGAAPIPTPTPACPDGYSDWLSSSFSFPDGDVIGATDFPSMPWASSGTLKIDTGKLSGTGSAIVSQGAAFPYAGSRVRFRSRFTDSNQQITAAFDAANDGSGGVRIEVDSSGHLSLTEGKTSIGHTDLAPLDTGVDWFVEATFEGTSAAISLSQKNYGSEKQAVVAATLETDALKVTAASTKTAVVLASGGGISPLLDELSFSRCGVAPPDYTALFIDTFERADSQTLGKAEFPVGTTWVDPGTDASIVGGAMELKGLGDAHVPLTVPVDALRIRATIGFGDADAIWAQVNYNSAVTPATSIVAEPGFWAWGSATKSVFLNVFLGDRPEAEHPEALLAKGTDYFMEFNRDAGNAVLTLRTTSFTGPIFAIDYDTGLTAAQNTGGRFHVGSSGSGAMIKDVRVDKYEAP